MPVIHSLNYCKEEKCSTSEIPIPRSELKNLVISHVTSTHSNYYHKGYRGVRVKLKGS